MNMNMKILFNNKHNNKAIKMIGFVREEINDYAIIIDNGTERTLKVNENTKGRFVRVKNITQYLGDLI